MQISTVIHAATGNFKKSKCFYERLEFEVLSQESPFIVSDGKAIVEVNPENFARNGVKLYGADLGKLKESLKGITAITEYEDGILASDPNGVKVYATNESLDLDFEPKEKSFGMTGNFAGLSIEAVDTRATADFWMALGFKHMQGDVEKGFAVYSNDSTVGISIMGANMCPHLFFNPGLTYFNAGKNLTVIGKLREAEIRFTEEITVFNDDGVADNAIINDPGGLGFFIFND